MSSFHDGTEKDWDAAGMIAILQINVHRNATAQELLALISEQSRNKDPIS